MASASPRRAELMVQAGWPFSVQPVDIEEGLGDGPIQAAVAELALRKARACRAEKGLVVGADTVVVLDGQVLGKPVSSQEAREMLGALSGREHRVITGVAVLNADTGEELAESEETAVRFRNLTVAEIDAYVHSGEPMDKAGAYGIQGKGAMLVEGITGCYFNVVGLPLSRLARMLQTAGFPDTYKF